MNTIYTDQTYLQQNPSWHAEDAVFKAGYIKTLLERNRLIPEDIAELGSGSGALLATLQKLLPDADRFTGYEISTDALAMAAPLANDQLRFLHRDITDLGDHAWYDLLLVIDVLEHLENYIHFLRSIRKKGRYTIFHIPLDLCTWSLFREEMLLEQRQKVGHIHLFTEDFIKEAIKSAGFDLIDQLYTPPTFEHLSTKQKFINQCRNALFRVAPRFTTKSLGGYSIMLLTKNGDGLPVVR
jgi:SAM-dependent methyltransferase